MQIAQFIFGASYAAMHLFVQYDIPIATPYKVLASVASVVSNASAAVSTATSSASSEISSVIQTPTATAAAGALLKKFLLRAAGEEGVAERIGIPHDNKPVQQHIEERIEQAAEHHHHPVPTYETRWRTDWTKVNCIDTSGEAFAIYLNLFYLFPLTVLFARFFVKHIFFVEESELSDLRLEGDKACVRLYLQSVQHDRYVSLRVEYRTHSSDGMRIHLVKSFRILHVSKLEGVPEDQDVCRTDVTMYPAALMQRA